MYMQQPSEYTEYGTPETGYADYRLEGGWNEFKRNGKPTKRGRHAGRKHDAVEMDRAAALEAERSEIVKLMVALQIFTGPRAVVRAYLKATS